MTAGPEFVLLKGPTGPSGPSEPMPPNAYALDHDVTSTVADAANLSSRGAKPGDVVLSASGTLYMMSAGVGGVPDLLSLGILAGPEGPNPGNTYVDPAHATPDHVTRPVRFAPGTYQALAQGAYLATNFGGFPPP
jgi:hypothetical protein